MRIDTTNTRAMSLRPNGGTTSMRAVIAQGPKGEDGSNVLPTDEAIKDAIENPASETAAALSASIAQQMGLSAIYEPEFPEDMPWDQPIPDVTVGIRPTGKSFAVASGFDMQTLMTAVSTALSGAEVWVDPVSGNNTTGDGTQGNPYQTWEKGQTVINTTGVPGQLHILSGVFSRAMRPSQGAVEPLVDTVVWIHGPVTISTHDDATFTKDTLYGGNAYAWTAADTPKLVRLDIQTRDGHYLEPPQQIGRALTKGGTTNGSARITNAGGGDPNGVGFDADDVGRGISGTGIPAGSVIAAVQSVTGIFIVQGSTQAARTITTTAGSTTIGGTFTAGDVGLSIAGPGIPAQGASGSTPNTIVSQTGTAAVIANAPTATGAVTALTATLATATATASNLAVTLTGSPTIVNRTPGAWCHNGVKGTYYPADGAIPVAANTRIYRNQSDVLRLTKLVNYCVLGTDETASLAIEGGVNAGLNINVTDFTPGSKRLLFDVPITARYATVYNGTTGRGVSCNSWPGLVVFAKPIEPSANSTDGLNLHDANAGTHDPQHVITFNRRGVDNGRPGQTSCQGGTSHEGVRWMDFCPTDERNHGGGIRNIGTSKTWCVAPNNADDRGDKILGSAGTIDPVGIRFDDQAEGWIDRPNITGAGMLDVVTTSAAVAHIRNAPPGLRTYAQPGTTIDTY